MAGPAAVLRVLVNADTAKAQAQLSKFDRQYTETRAKTEKAVQAQLGADFNPAAFAAYEAALDRAKRRTSDKSAFKAALGGEFDPRAFNAYQRELTKIENANKRAETSHVRMGMSARGASGGVDKLRNSVIGLVKESAVISAFGIAAQAVSALGAAATATTAGLSPLVGIWAAYPAVASAGVQALGTLKLAFDGVKTAVGGINQQLDKNSKAFRELTPEGKKFAEQLESMKAPLRDLSQTAQRGLMPGLVAGLKDAMGNFDVFNRGIAGASRAIGMLAHQAGALVGSKGFGTDLDTQMKRNNVTISRLGQAGLYLADALRHVILSAGPLVDWMTRTTTILARQVDAWAAAGRESGKFAQFFEQTRRVMTEVGHIAANLAVALVNIFKGAYPTGQSLLQILEGLSKRFREWTGSAAGQNAIRTFFEQQKPAMIEAGRLLGAIVQAFGRLGSGTQVAPLLAMIRTQLLPAFERLLQNTTATFGPTFVNALKNAMLIFTQLGGSSGPLVTVVTLFGKLAESANWLLSHIPGLAPAIVGAFVVGKVVAFGTALEGVAKKYLGLLALGAKPFVPQVASNVSKGAAVAGAVPLMDLRQVETQATSIGGKLKSGLQTAMSSAGTAIGGVLMTQLAASIAGPGAAAKWITAIGTGGSIGAALGSIFGPLGAAGGAVIGGLAGALLNWVRGPDPVIEGRQWAANFASQLPGTLIPKVKTALGQAAGGATATFAQRSPSNLQPPAGQFAGLQPMSSVQATQYSAQWNKAFNDVYNAAFRWGGAAGQIFGTQMQALSRPTELIFGANMDRILSQVPKKVQAQGPAMVNAWRQGALQQMVAYSTQLEQSGRLPRGATARMIQSVEQQFPGLKNFIANSGIQTAQGLASAFHFTQAQNNLRGAVQGFRNTYGDMAMDAKITNGNILKNASIMAIDLQGLMRTGPRQGRLAAAAEYRKLRADVNTYFAGYLATTQAKFAGIAAVMGTKSAAGRNAAHKAFDAFSNDVFSAMADGVYSTSKGAELISKAVNSALNTYGSGFHVPTATILFLTRAGKQGVSTGAGGRHLAQGGGYLGRPGAVGPDSIPVLAAPGEAVLNRHQQKFVNSALQQTYGTNLPGLFSKVKTPHAMQKGGIAGFAQGGLTASAVNQATGANRVQFSGPVSTFGPPGEAAGPTAYGRNSAQPGLSLRIPGTHWSDPQNRALMGHVFNLRVAGHQGNFLDFDLGPADWTGKNIDVTGAAVQAMGFNYGAFPTGSIGTVTQLGPGAIATIGAAVGAAMGAQAWKAIKAPKVAGSGTVAKIVRAALGKMTGAANKYGQAHMPVAAPGTGAGVSTAGITGKGGAGTFDGLTVANWIVQILNWARGHGWTGHITSGYRPGSITNVGNVSNHASLNYPGGAVDVGDETAMAQGLALWNVVKNYPGTPKLYSAAWGPGAWGPYKGSPHDYGHFSATGHQRGGFIGQLMATGGAPLAGKAPAKGKPIPSAWHGKGYDKPGWKGVKGDPRPAREKLSPGWGKMPTGGAGIGPSQLQQVAASAGKAEKIIGQGGPFPFGEGDIASISAMLSRLDKLEGIGSGQLGGGDVGKQSSLIQWFENSFWSSGLFPDPNFSSWNTPANFVISQDANGNQITPYVSPHIDQVVQQLGQSLGWFNTIVADHQAAVATVNALLPRIQTAINRRVAIIAKIRARISKNVERIRDLQAKVKAEQARKLPYAKPKTGAQKSANTAFDTARKQRIDAWNNQIGGIQDENKVLTGAKDGTGTTGELATLTAELGTRPGGLLAGYMGGSSASGLYQLQQSAQDWVGQISAVGGLLDQAKLDRDLRANGLAALKPGASAAAVSAAAQQSSATAATDNSQLLQLLQDWKTSQARETAVAAAQAAVLSQPLVGAFASGGTVPRTGFALVGEQGPELAALPQGTRVYSNATTNNIMQGGGGHDVHLHFAPGTEWLRQFVDVRVEQKTRKAAGNRAPLPGMRG